VRESEREVNLEYHENRPIKYREHSQTRLATGVATREELLACLDHLLATAGNAGLMTKELRHTLCDHAAGNYRIFIGMAAELLMTAAQREITVLDEKLYLQVFAPPETQSPRRVAAAR
jgi:general secretion pathway protein A